MTCQSPLSSRGGERERLFAIPTSPLGARLYWRSMDPRRDIGTPSTRFTREYAKIKRPRRATGKRGGVAAPHRLAPVLGRRSPVTVELCAVRGAEAWIRVSDSRGTWYVNADAGVGDLVQQVIAGGHWVTRLARPSTTSQG